jgi:hypothetical protein
MPNQFVGWWSFVVCDSFGDETYGDVNTSGDNVRGRNVRGHIVPVPTSTRYHQAHPVGGGGRGAWRAGKTPGVNLSNIISEQLVSAGKFNYIVIQGVDNTDFNAKTREGGFSPVRASRSATQFMWMVI